ncbi:MAG TPA: low-specificity L-threonine aldolase [Bacillota bacterium]|nr:low-specificity L-threonine aldolase [Bacillota bacterium]
MIDLRSDTVTKPTSAMREAIFHAEVGDDVYGEDPTLRKLECMAAERVGKEAALFVPSGTMGNQIAVLTHTERGDEIILEANAHIFYYEVGGPAVLSGVQTRPIKGVKGFIDPDEIHAAIRDENIHTPRTGLLCLENTHNRAGGAVLTAEQMKRMADVAHEHGIPVHLDGARIFNAAISLGVDVKELTKEVDSVMFCISKGLSAPVGSLLTGSESFIRKARKNRKLLGGGMRQAGILAAAGIVALETMIDRLREDHQNARRLAESLAKLPGIGIDPADVVTNILIFSVKDLKISADAFEELLAQEGLLCSSFGPTDVRFVTHKDVTAGQIEEAIKILTRLTHQLAG